MKTTVFLRLVVFMYFITYLGCSEGSDDERGMDEQEQEFLGIMQAEIGSNTFRFTSTAGAFLRTDGRVYISALNCESNNQITIYLFPDIGTYSLEPDNFDNTHVIYSIGFPCDPYFDDLANGIYNSRSGSITIIESTEQKIAGIFAFNCESSGGDVLSVNNGTFDFLYD